MSLRPIELDRDQVAIHALSEASFASSSDYQTASFEVFSEEEFQAHDFAPELSLLAECRPEAVGFLLARRWQTENAGFVSLLGVRPDHRGAGLGLALLTAAFTRFAAAGLGEAQLGVASDNPSALRLYQRCGMAERFRYETYERPVQTDS